MEMLWTALYLIGFATAVYTAFATWGRIHWCFYLPVVIGCAFWPVFVVIFSVICTYDGNGNLVKKHPAGWQYER